MGTSVEGIAESCLAVLMIDDPYTSRWYRYQAIGTIDQLIREKAFDQLQPFTIIYRGKRLIVDPSAWECMTSFLNYDVVAANPAAGLDRPELTLLQLMGCECFTSVSAAERAVNVWYLRLAIEEKGLPVPNNPAKLNIFYHEPPKRLTYKPMAFAWKLVLKHIQAHYQVRRPDFSLEQACVRFNTWNGK